MRYDIINRCKDMHAYTVGPGYVTYQVLLMFLYTGRLRLESK